MKAALKLYSVSRSYYVIPSRSFLVIVWSSQEYYIPWHPHPGILMADFISIQSFTQTIDSGLTTVMDIDAAFGKINLISSNLPRRLKFSAMGILKSIRSLRNINNANLVHTILIHCAQN